ncbi:MAG: sel1 repeat family protein [Prevotella sp.]|nr:sel1 repeat family protein [Prevotella sp.]
MLEKGWKNKTEKKDSIAVIIEKANQGDAEAQNTVAKWLYYGYGNLKQDYEKALQFWVLAAKQDNVGAIAGMAMCYQFEHGAKRDSTMAMGPGGSTRSARTLHIVDVNEVFEGNNTACYVMEYLDEKTLGKYYVMIDALEQLDKAS